MSDKLEDENLPDFVTKKVDMLTAAKLFKKAVDKQCRQIGQDPHWETNMLTYGRQHGSKGSDFDKQICVNWEAGPHDWGVAYSLGANPKSYMLHENIQDWYLECYWGFDVIFTPIDFAKSLRYKDVQIGKPMAKGMIPNYTVEINTLN